MITSLTKGFYTTSLQQNLVGLNLVFETILIFYSVDSILIQVNLSQEQIPKILITQLPNRRVTQNKGA